MIIKESIYVLYIFLMGSFPLLLFIGFFFIYFEPFLENVSLLLYLLQNNKKKMFLSI